MPQKICKKGHKFYKSSDCLSCPICNEEEKPTAGFLAKLYSPARNALLKIGTDTVEKLSEYTEKEILNLHGMGKSSLPILRSSLAEKGLKFRPDQSQQFKSGSPKKMQAYESFADWEEKESARNELTKVVSKYLQSAAPHLETIVKWGQGCFLKNGKPAIYIHTEPDHVQLGFYNGTKLTDPNKILEGKAKYVRHLKILTPSDLQNKQVDYFIKQVV